MTRWAAFAGLTALLTSSLLALARLSRDSVGTSSDSSSVTDPPEDAVEHGSTSPRSSSPHEYAFSDSAAVTDALDSQGSGTGPGVRDHPRAPVVPRFEEPPEAQTVSDENPAVPEISTGALLVNVALTQGLFGGVLAAGALYFQVPLSALGLAGSQFATGFAGVAVGVALGVVLWLCNEAAGVLVERAGLGYDESLRSLLAPDSATGWALLLGGVLPTVALVEEFVFRAAAIDAVATGFPAASPWALAVVSSVAFGLAHGVQGRTGILVTGGLGFALAAAFVLTQSLLVVVVAHYLVNALELVVHEGLGVERPLLAASE